MNKPIQTRLKTKFERILPYFLTLIIPLIFFKLTREILAKDTLNFDQAINSWIAQFRNLRLTQLMIQISSIGEKGAFVLIAILAVYTIIKKQYYGFFNLLLSTSSALLFTFFLKRLVMRPRPDLLLRLVSETSFSYPSGHATVTFTVFPIIAIYLALHTKLKNPIKILVWIIALLIPITVSFSRLYLGVHYFTDTFAGAFIGLTFAYIYYLIDKKTTHILRHKEIPNALD